MIWNLRNVPIKQITDENIVQCAYWKALRNVLIYTCKAERDTLTEGGEEMQEMTTAELNQYLENIAKLIEATAENAEAAAKIVRESKVKA